MPDVDSGVTDSTASTSQDMDLLNSEETVETPQDQRTIPVKPPVKEPEKKEHPEPDEEEGEEPTPPSPEEDKEEEEEPTEAKPPVHDRPTMQQLRETFPDLFKKFPAMRDIYYREQEFSQIFPTVEDAKEASSNAEAFTDISDKVLKADTQGLFSAIKETDEKAFTKISEEILPTLYRISPDAHWKATLPLMQNLVRGFYMEGQRRNDDNVKNSAEYLSDYIFGDIKIARGERDITPKKVEESEEQKEFNAEKAKFMVDRVESFTRNIRSSADESLRNSVVHGGKIDPDGVFSDFIKETIVGKVLSEVDRQLTADKSHMRYMNSLWEKAKREGFTDDWKSRILTAYLARAKSLIPTIRAKYVSEAQGSSSKAAEKAKTITEKNSSRREPGTGGRTSKESNNGHLDAKRIDWSKTSDLDLLEDRVTLKK